MERETVMVFQGRYVATPMDISEHLHNYTRDYYAEGGDFLKMTPKGDSMRMKLFIDLINDPKPVNYGDYRRPMKVVDFGYLEIIGSSEASPGPTLVKIHSPKYDVSFMFWDSYQEALDSKYFQVYDEIAAMSKSGIKYEPWNSIDDHLWDRDAVELWCKGYSSRQIGKHVGVDHRTVTNRISALRQRYPHLVPTNEERRKLNLRKTRDDL